MSVSPALPAVPLRGILAEWDALAIRWDLSSEERSSLLGGMVEGPIDEVATYDPAAAEARMRLLVALEPVLVAVHVDEDRTREWLRRPNACLRGSTPVQVMSSSPEWIRWLIDAVGISA